MEKLQTLAWILIGLAIFIWRMVQKARATTQREQQERRFSRPDSTGRPRPVAPLPSTSFEELLKQMQAQNHPAKPASAPNPASEEKTPGGRPLPREAARSQEKTEVTARSQERTVVARSLETPAHDARRASTLPRAATRDTPANNYWKQDEARRHETRRPELNRNIRDLLKTPADLRNAFILSEILQRRF